MKRKRKYQGLSKPKKYQDGGDTQDGGGAQDSWQDYYDREDYREWYGEDIWHGERPDYNRRDEWREGWHRDADYWDSVNNTGRFAPKPFDFGPIIPMLGQLFEGEMGQRNMKQNDVFNPIQGFHGFNYQKGGNINTTGYTPGFKSFNNKYNIIPSSSITMQNTPFPVIGKSLETGETKIMKPGSKHKFKNTKNVLEVPAYQQGGPTQQEPQQMSQLTQFEDSMFSFLPLLLDDPRNTLNSGNRPMIEIQTEKGEFIVNPELGDIVKVAAKEKHKNQESDDVSDVTADGNYVLSHDKGMAFKNDKHGNIKFEDIVMGIEPLYYEEGKLNKVPKKFTLKDTAPNKNKYTPAEWGDNIAKKFPVTKRENDPFAIRAQVENKQSRLPYIQSLIQLSEMKRPTQASDPTSKYKKGGFTSIGAIYGPLLKQASNYLNESGATGTYFPKDPMLVSNKRDKAMIKSYQDGGEIYKDSRKDKGGLNRREQWNYWLNQAQDAFHDFTYNTAIPNLDAQSTLQLLGTLGQEAYQGDNEFLYGNQYRSQLDNLKNSQDRSLDAETAYASSLMDRENSLVRAGANAGLDPRDLTSNRANALRASNDMITNVGRERRTLADKYGTLGLNATDMFAGRQNQQKSYLNDFNNNRIQSLANIGVGNLNNRLSAEAANQTAQTQYQLMEKPGNAWTDFTTGAADFLNLIAGVAGVFTGFGGGGQRGGGQQQANGTYSGYSPFSNGVPTFSVPAFTPPVFSGGPTFNSPLTAPSGYGSYRNPAYDPFG